MTNANQRDPKQLVLVMQIITGAMALGVVIFLAIAVIITQGQQPKDPFLAYLGIGFAAIAALGSFLLRLPVNLNEIRKENFDPRAEEVFFTLAPIYQTELIVKLALLEGAAFFNGVAYMVETQWWSLAAMAILILIMVFRFPTASRIAHWIERRTIELRF